MICKFNTQQQHYHHLPSQVNYGMNLFNQTEGKQDSWHCWRKDNVNLTDSNGKPVGYGGDELISPDYYLQAR